MIVGNRLATGGSVKRMLSVRHAEGWIVLVLVFGKVHADAEGWNRFCTNVRECRWGDGVPA